ncbi:hypothetical protein SBV1_2550006 [Verrucomicrobia bacterium]|nr:hypothetical protein SBV1_2550006 [Verrucomicrobiota bacterium]
MVETLLRRPGPGLTFVGRFNDARILKNMAVMRVAGLLRILAAGDEHIQDAIHAIGIHRLPIGVVRPRGSFSVARHVAESKTVKVVGIVPDKLPKGDAPPGNAAETRTVIIAGIKAAVVGPGRRPFVSRAVCDLQVSRVESHIHDRLIATPEQRELKREYQQYQLRFEEPDRAGARQFLARHGSLPRRVLNFVPYHLNERALSQENRGEAIP